MHAWCKVGLDRFPTRGYPVAMNIRYREPSLEALVFQPGDAGRPPGVVNKFRERIGYIKATDDERVFYKMKSLHYEKLKGKRKHQHSMKLNDQWRLVLEYEGKGEDRIFWIVAIEDYH
jgi:proteic killer suppression protein